MSVTSKDYRRGGAPAAWSWSDLDWRKVSAAAIFVLSVVLTKDFISQWAAPWIAAVFAVPVQLGLTHLESPIFRRWEFIPIDDKGNGERVRRDITGINWAALGGDGVINAVGAWPFWRTAHEKKFFLDLADMMGHTTQPLRGPLAFLVCFACGVLVAAGFERLWYDKQYVA